MPVWLTSVLAVVAALGGIAQVVVAYVAVTLASAANTVNRRAYLQQRLSADLAEALNLARDVRRKYRAMFRPFTTATHKESARTKWLEAGEDVAQTLRELAQIDEIVRPAVDAWIAVENTPDRHAGNDKLVCSNDDRDRELRLYETNYANFSAAIGGAIRKLQEPHKSA